MEGNQREGLFIDVLHTGQNGLAMVTALFNGEVIAHEKRDLSKPSERLAFADRLCGGRSGIDPQQIENQLMIRSAEHAAKARVPGDKAPPPVVPTSADLLAAMPVTARLEAGEMLSDPKLFERVVNDVAALGVAGERELGAVTYLTATSRMLDKPLAAIVQGPSSSGKSYTPSKVSRLVPPEAILMATQITSQALFYMPPGSLSHRFVLAGERSRIQDDEAADATRALREMLSAGRLTKMLTVKEEGKFVARMIEQDGPIAFMESTTVAKIFDEDANRCLLLQTDERPEQTRRIVTRLAAGYSGALAVGNAEQIIQRHHALQRMLEPLPVVIPYAVRLGELFDTERVEVRRGFPQMMSMIQAIALLHQRQRERDADGRVLAEAADYQLARHLLAKPLARLLGRTLSDAAARFLGRLGDRFGAETFTTTEAAKGECVCNRAIRDWLSALADSGLVDPIEPSRGQRPASWRVSPSASNQPEAGCPQLPTLEAVFGRGTSDNPTTTNV